MNQLITKEYNVISNVSTEFSNKELEGTLQNHLHAYLFGHPEPKPSGHKKYNVMNNVSTHTSYTSKHLRASVLNKIHVVN